MYACLGLALLLGGSVAGICYRIHRENGRESTTGLPYHRRPGGLDRLLLIAPHPDDETLACGGLLFRAMQAHAVVRVVLVTNGDGFPLAVRRAYSRVRLRPADYTHLGMRRQREALAALSHLEVPSQDVLFLGYPDHGISHLWLDNWDEDAPYISNYTRAASSPYPNAYRAGAPYCGRALLEDLEQIITGFHPTAVYAPHPNDEHPDHWATACFVSAALEHLRLADRVPVFTYLVHRGDWPVPQGLHRASSLPPPAALAHLDTAWSAFPLRQDAEAAKGAALPEHRTQLAVMQRFLTSFLRRTELFGVLPAITVRRAPPGGVRVDSDSAEWTAIRPAIEDPTADSLPVELQGGADLTAVRACQDDRLLYVLVSSRRPMSKRFTYVLHLRPLDTVMPALAITLRLGRPTTPPDVPVTARGRYIEVAVPLSRLGGAHAVSIGAVSRIRRFTVDSTGWRILHLSPPGSQAPTPPQRASAADAS